MKNYAAKFSDKHYQLITNAVAWCNLPQNREQEHAPLTINEFITTAAAGYYDFLRNRHNDGDHFPIGRLPRGRPKGRKGK